MTEPVRKLFADTQPVNADDVTPEFVATARAVAAIAATRCLLFCTVATGAAIWSYAVWLPTPDRLYAAVSFSLVFMLPQIILYLRKG